MRLSEAWTPAGMPAPRRPRRPWWSMRHRPRAPWLSKPRAALTDRAEVAPGDHLPACSARPRVRGGADGRGARACREGGAGDRGAVRLDDGGDAMKKTTRPGRGADPSCRRCHVERAGADGRSGPQGAAGAARSRHHAAAQASGRGPRLHVASAGRGSDRPTVRALRGLIRPDRGLILTRPPARSGAAIGVGKWPHGWRSAGTW